ncbi:MAG: DUF4432 family protein [Chloroflexi bacterium]|nr:DUF4432 family protein [Chloroflexota bacterium]
MMMNTITLHNAHLDVVVDLEHGAEITHIANAQGVNMLYYADWQSPVRASRSTSYGNGVYDWLSEYRGGWQELFPNAGNPCEVMGTPLPFHGEVSRAQWQAEWKTPGLDVVLSTGARLPIVLERRMRLIPDRAVLFIEETIRNESDLELPYLWGHHPAWGPPLAAQGARIDLPGGKLTVDSGLDGPTVDLQPGSSHSWPQVSDRKGNSVDLSVVPAAPLQRLCYLQGLSAGWYALRNPADSLGVAMAWDVKTFPHLWMWQEIGGGQGMPWYGRAEITALEPATQFPSHGLAEAIKAGTAHTLAPRAEASTWLTVALFAADERPVQGVSADGAITF